MEFEHFASIAILESHCVISEKIHGTNAQIAIPDDLSTIFAGSRERWVTPEDDNAGFARKVYAEKEALFKALGPGRHFGEWYGSGIGSGYGLKEKRFALFNTHRWTQPKKDGLLPAWVDVVPILYEGNFTPTIVDETMAKLKESGSAAVPGFKKPEGIVVYFSRSNTMYKKVFESEDTRWDQKDKKEKAPPDPVFEAKVDSYLHPIRLEKLLMRDERYLREYPKSMPEICKAYIDDLVKEANPPIENLVLDAVKKKAFKMVKTIADSWKNGSP
jgi:hypothetical protein